MNVNSSDYGSLTSFLMAFDSAVQSRESLKLECLLSLTDAKRNPSLHRLCSAGILNSSNLGQQTKDASQIRRGVPSSWIETVIEFWSAAHYLKSPADAVEAFAHAAAMLQAIIKEFTAWEAWVLPVLFSACRDCRVLAIRADELCRSEDKAAENLEEAARLINKAFTICITDRAPENATRKWGTYNVIGTLFRVYFRLNKLSLTKNVLRAVEVSQLPELRYFPKAHQVTWKYYLGVIAFMNEDYPLAQTKLSEALSMCTRNARGNVELILSYLIPTHLMTTRMIPSISLLRQFPKISALYTPLIIALRSGNINAYDRSLARNEAEFIRRRVYLTLERARDLCLRSLFRKIYIVLGSNTRVPIDKFRRGLNMGLKPDHTDYVDEDEAECYVANLIYKGFMKGYISREKRMVVLSAKTPFPRVCRSVP